MTLHRVQEIRIGYGSVQSSAASTKKADEEALFGWIVSDFGLNDAIEAGLVKTPRLVVRDDGKMTSDYKSRLYHIYMDDEVKDDLNRKAEEHEPLPDLVVNGCYLLGKDWLETSKDWRNAGHQVPPVMITVANQTYTAARIKYAFDHGKIRIDELAKPDRKLHIDSKVLETAEAQDEAAALAINGGDAENVDGEDNGKPQKKLTKQQQAELLRQKVDTVGLAVAHRPASIDSRRLRDDRADRGECSAPISICVPPGSRTETPHAAGTTVTGWKTWRSSEQASRPWARAPRCSTRVDRRSACGPSFFRQ